jgi:ribosome-associated toxin RatA of RatAB toxin-antitoxin module
MPVYQGRREIDIPAPPRACFDVLTDYERLPDWQSMVRRCEILTRDDAGRAEEVEYEIDALVRRVTYRIRHVYEEPRRVGSEYLGGDFECFEGQWTFDDRGDEGTHVTFELRIDPGLRVPERLARLLNEAVMGRALSDLRARVSEVRRGERLRRPPRG